MKRIFYALAAVLVAGGTACEDAFGPRNWEARVDTLTLYSIVRPEYQGLPSAYDIVSDRPVVVESLAGGTDWDFALTEVEGGLSLIPPGAVEGLPASAGIGQVAGSFEALEEAPRDSSFYDATAPTPLEAGRTYAVRSRENPRAAGCIYFAKVKAVEVEPETGVARLAITENPFCNDRALVPPGR